MVYDGQPVEVIKKTDHTVDAYLSMLDSTVITQYGTCTKHDKSHRKCELFDGYYLQPK